MAKFFLSLFYKINSSTFRTAILANDINKICRVLDIERDHICKELDDAGNTALLLAIKHASPLTVRVLLEQGANPDQPNYVDFQTPLSSLAAKNYENHQFHEAKIALEKATMLLDYGAYVDKPSLYVVRDENDKDYSIKETPLMTAVRTKNLPMATLFVEKKANVNYIEKQTGNRPIHFSITNGDTAMFDLLENAGASCRSVITNGDNTLLHWFCYNKANDERMSLLKKIINKNCNVNAENNFQQTPLMLAAKLDMINTCHILLHTSADIDKIDYLGNRAIDLAIIGSESFKLLKKIQKIQSQQYYKTDRILWKKQISSTCSLLKQSNESLDPSYNDDNNLKNCLSNEFNREEFDTKYKRMWEKFLQTKQKIRRTRDSSLQRSKDYTQSRKRNISQQRTSDLSQKDNTITVKL